MVETDLSRFSRWFNDIIGIFLGGPHYSEFQSRGFQLLRNFNNRYAMAS